MAQYTVQSPDGRQITLEGDTPPTENDLDRVFSSLPPKENIDVATNKPMEGSKEANGVYQGPSLISRIPAANREALRSIGTGKNFLDSYMQGLDNPSKSETFQDQLLRTGIIPNQNGTTSTLNSFLGGVAGQMADMATSPISAIAMATGDFPLKQAGSAIKSVATTSAKPAIQELSQLGAMAKNAVMSKFAGFQKPSIPEIESMIGQASDESKGMQAVINRGQVADETATNAKYLAQKNNLNSAIQQVSKQDIPKAADAATVATREAYPTWARDISNRYGEAYQAAIKGQKIGTQKLYDALGEVVNESGILAKPEAQLSSSERAIYNYWKNVEGQLPGVKDSEVVFSPTEGPIHKTVTTGQQELDLTKVDSDLQRILNAQKGKQYGPGEHILTIAREKMANAIGDISPEVKLVRAKFKPELQMKNEAYKIFQPFSRSGEYDTTAGTNLLSRYANTFSGGKMNPDELRLINSMKQKFGKDFFGNLESLGNTKNQMVNQLKGLGVSQQDELNAIQIMHDEARARDMMDTQNHMSLLDAMLQNANKDKAIGDFVGLIGKTAAVSGVGAATAGAVYKGAELAGKALG